MEKPNSNDLIAIIVSGFIVGVIMLLLHYLIDTWSNDEKFIVASILAIVGFLILRRMRDRPRDHRMFFLTVGNTLFGVGAAILLTPLIEWIVERTVS